MARQEKFTFKIDGQRPDTIGIGRLIAYYQELARLIGHPDAVHLLGIQEGSHVNILAVQSRHSSDVRKRLGGIADGNAPKEAIASYDRLNQLLYEDNSSAKISDESGAEIIPFPGRPKIEDKNIQIVEHGTIGGTLYYLCGNHTNVTARVRLASGRVVQCTTSEKIAHEMRGTLFEEVRIHGKGLWERDQNGRWVALSMEISSFDPIDRLSLTDAVKQLRAVQIDWPEDPLEEAHQFNVERNTN